MVKVGDRVGAMACANKDEVQMYGYGVYVGEEKPEVPVMGIPIEKLPPGLTNPKIVLDNGDIVWGCECWWGPEAAMQKYVDKRIEAGAKLVYVDIKESRVDIEPEIIEDF